MKVLLTATVQSHICQFHKPLVEMLHEHGCEVHVAARDNLAEKNGLKLDFVEKVFNVPFARSPKSTDNIEAYKQLKKIIDEGNYNIIHCNTPMGGIVTRLAARDARKRGTKVFYTAHGFHFYKGAPIINWLIYYPIEKFFAKHYTDSLITINEKDYQFASKKFNCKVEHIHGVGVDEKRFFPVDEAEKFRLRKQMGYEDNRKLILCVGELLPNKNQQMAIRMMAELVKHYPDALLLLAGNGPERVNLEKLTDELNLLNNVKFLGYVTNLQDYLHIVDVSISCSKREGLGLNLIEAMMCGKPVIASHNRGHNELIENGINGYLYENELFSDLSEKIMSINQSREQFKVENSVAQAKKYCADSVKKELMKIYCNS